MQDIRAMRDGHGQQPWQLARNLNFPMSIEQEEVHYLHPRVPLEVCWRHKPFFMRVCIKVTLPQAHRRSECSDQRT